MKIVVEAGATKSDWRILGGCGPERLLLPGMNVSTAAPEHNRQVLRDGLAQAGAGSLAQVGAGSLAQVGAGSLDGFYLYTAGIVTPQVREDLSAFIRSICDVRDIDIQDDLVAAARAVCGRSEGIVAILGTGSNACFWDGGAVSFRVRSGGYILGDEGGGAVLGKLFLSDYIKGAVPAAVAADFASRFDATYEGIVALVYRSESPAGALGSLAPFILSHYGDPYVKALVDGNFRSFVRRSLLKYDTARYPVGVVGGWGNACRDIFTRICAEEGVRVGRFESEPIRGLLEYHSA